MMLPAASTLQKHHRDLRMPVLIVMGDGDRIVDFRRQSQKLHEMLPQSRLVVLQGVGHMVHHLEARRIQQAMVDIMQKGATDPQRPVTSSSMNFR